MRKKKCAVCKTSFMPDRPFQAVCSVPCAIEQAKGNRERLLQKKEKEEKKEDRKKKEALKTARDYIKDAQAYFNSYVRVRDKLQTCICCGKPLNSNGSAVGGAYDAGHYRSVGSAPHMRFDENNCHAQRKQCNQWGAGRAVDYRIGLIKRIGLAEVERIESDQTPRHYTIEQLKEIISTYKRKRKELENG